MVDRKRRADAVGNRNRIVDVARELLGSTSGLPMSAVAKAAGVGQGTLYRNFPTREALLAEVYRADVERLAAAAGPLLEQHDGASALRLWFDHVADYAQLKRGVLAALEPESGQGLVTSHTGTISDAITLLLDAGRQQGVLRGDVTAADVLVLLGFLSRLNEGEPLARINHLLDLVVAGLRP